MNTSQSAPSNANARTAGPDPLEVGLAVLERFNAHNRKAQEAGTVLRNEIRELLRTHVGPSAATAARVRTRLTRSPLPALRTVQWHLQAIRSEKSDGV